ncbi:MAG: hypothetical protein ABIH52_02730 [Candidatus Aenigmatarchaeota archaeon]|nr:hypothetical protein [Nanoarchaeota archaeon]
MNDLLKVLAERPIILSVNATIEHEMWVAKKVSNLIGAVMINYFDSLRADLVIKQFRDMGIIVMADSQLAGKTGIVERTKFWINAGANLLTVMADSTQEVFYAVHDVCKGAEAIPVSVTTNIPENKLQSRMNIATVAGVPMMMCTPSEAGIIGNDIDNPPKFLACGIETKNDIQRAIEASASGFVIGSQIFIAGDKDDAKAKLAAVTTHNSIIKKLRMEAFEVH